VRLDVRDLTVGAMPVQGGRPGLPGRPPVPPRHHRHQHVDELGALPGQHVLVARRALGVAAALDHARLDGDEAWEVIDRIAQKYIGGPYPLREDRVVLLVEPERASAMAF
jgi:hypothetical protein